MTKTGALVNRKAFSHNSGFVQAFTMNLLLVHGNGGASSRFKLFIAHLEKDDQSLTKAFIPELPGFEGRPIPGGKLDWKGLIRPLQTVISDRHQQEWVLYGHGIGGSILLEWASRGFSLTETVSWEPKAVILHAPIGASLAHRWFPKVMKVRPMRALIHWLIYQKWLQAAWEKKLFLKPDQIPAKLKDQFFRDYRQCKAFPGLFDLIDEAWYAQVRSRLNEYPFRFIWGEKERVVASQFLQYWKNDFPRSHFELIPEWDHFPMLEQPTEFYDKMKQLIKDIKAEDQL